MRRYYENGGDGVFMFALGDDEQSGVNTFVGHQFSVRTKSGETVRRLKPRQCREDRRESVRDVRRNCRINPCFTVAFQLSPRRRERRQRHRQVGIYTVKDSPMAQIFRAKPKGKSEL